MNHIQQQKVIINKAINSYLKEPFRTKFFEAARYTIYPEGHRFRSLIGLEVYKLLGGNQKNFLKGIVGIEAIHHASLVFDDLPCMDNSPMRKGKPTTYIQFSEDSAILGGLYLWEKGRQLLYEASYEHLQDLKKVREVEELIHNTIINMLIGQELDLRIGKDEMELYESINKKNGLFHLICVIPAYLLQKPQYLSPLNKIGSILDEIGIDLSIGYQLFDDLRDVEGKPKITGKLTRLNKNRETSVSRYGAKEVKKELEERRKKIIQNIRKIQLNSRFEELINFILNEPS